jgi:hypothetical protein
MTASASPDQLRDSVSELAHRHISNFVDGEWLEASGAGRSRPGHTLPPLTAARHEFEACVDTIRFAAGAARVLHGPIAGTYVSETTSIFQRQPYGVVAGITPWNFPLLQALVKIAGALAGMHEAVLGHPQLIDSQFLEEPGRAGKVTDVAGRREKRADAWTTAHGRRP